MAKARGSKTLKTAEELVMESITQEEKTPLKTAVEVVADALEDKPSSLPATAPAKIDNGDEKENAEQVPMAMGSALAEAGRAYLQHQMEKLTKSKKAVLENYDPTGIHDTRVATRRLRDALKILENTVYEPQKTEYYRKQLHKLTTELGVARDTDVFLEDLHKYKAGLDEEQAAGLQYLEQYLENKRKQARIATLKIMRKHKIQQALRSLEDFVNTPNAGTIDHSDKGGSVKPWRVRDFVASIIWKNYEGMLAYQPVMDEYENATMTNLHQLRIAAKHLRYTLEFFSNALPNKAADLISQITEIQDYLGKLHDHDVAVTTCDGILSAHPEDTALQTYRQFRRAERDRLKAEFPPKWEALSNTEFRQKLNKLIQ